MWTEKQNRQASVLLNLRCPQNRVTHLEGVSKSIQSVEPYGQCHSQSTKLRTGGAGLWIRKLLLQYRWIISSLTGPSWDFSCIFRGMKNRAVNVCLVKSDINITLERLFPHICLSEAFHSAWLMGIEFASKLNAMVEGTTWGLDCRTYHIWRCSKI